MATFKSKMKHLEENWERAIWEKAQARNRGAGANWLLPIAALYLTGVRPASLEKGIVFSTRQHNEPPFQFYLVGTFQGAKILKNADGTARRGQDEVTIEWKIPTTKKDAEESPELVSILNALRAGGGKTLTVQYDAEGISTRLREMSKQIWPRKTYHVSAVCYRELFASRSKAAGVDAVDLAKAMGHLSAESQGKYAAPSRRKRASDAVSPKKTFAAVRATSEVKATRAPMARFKAATALKNALKKASKP